MNRHHPTPSGPKPYGPPRDNRAQLSLNSYKSRLGCAGARGEMISQGSRGKSAPEHSVISRKPSVCQGAGAGEQDFTLARTAVPEPIRARAARSYFAWKRLSGSLRQLPDLTCGPSPRAWLPSRSGGDVDCLLPSPSTAPVSCDVSSRILLVWI